MCGCGVSCRRNYAHWRSHSSREDLRGDRSDGGRAGTLFITAQGLKPNTSAACNEQNDQCRLLKMKFLSLLINSWIKPLGSEIKALKHASCKLTFFITEPTQSCQYLQFSVYDRSPFYYVTICIFWGFFFFTFFVTIPVVNCYYLQFDTFTMLPFMICDPYYVTILIFNFGPF